MSCQWESGMVKVHLQVGIYDKYQHIHDALLEKVNIHLGSWLW